MIITARAWWSLVVLAMLMAPAAAGGQTPALPEQPLLGSTLTADLLQDLPVDNTPFAVLERIQSESIADRFLSGGLNAATPPKFGGYLNSWNQTQFRLGDINITDPRAGGMPLLLPALRLWERVTTATGAMGVDENAPALSMRLDPQRPGAAWVHLIEGSLSGGSLVSDGTGLAPAVDRVRHWREGTAFVSGPVTDRLGLFAAGSWRELSHWPAPATNASSDRVVSGFTHFVFAPAPRDEVRTIAWVQQVTTAASTDTGVHLQSTWERKEPAAAAWRVFGGFTGRNRTAPMTPALIVDSLTSDPVSDLFDTGVGSVRRWTLGARAARPASKWLPSAGVDLEGAFLHAGRNGLEQIREFLDGSPARLWTLRGGGDPDIRHSTTFSAYGNERLSFERVTLEAGLRLDAVSAKADAAARGIGWATWLPHGLLRWQIVNKYLALVPAYRRSAYQVPLNVLAIGDPNAPAADVSLWDGRSSGPLIARVGPGTSGDPALTQIDRQMKRPITDEFVLALESRPVPQLQLKTAGIVKRQRPLLGLVDSGVPSSDYIAFQVPGTSFPPGNPVEAPPLTAYSRPAGAYGKDRYLLTNRSGAPAMFWAWAASIRASTRRFDLLAEGTMWSRLVGPAAAIGFLPASNDQEVLGNLLVEPNAASLSRGQLFQDRSHTVKLTYVYRFSGGVRVGVIARYQDGQPFARLVILPDLVQGPTAVRASLNGATAFTYTGTLDIRVQKLLTVGHSNLALILDVYNLPNLGNEASEYVVDGPRFRTPTALQPARTAIVGVRVTF